VLAHEGCCIIKETMAAVQTTSLAPAPRQRARFEALRRKLFADMGWAVARWRLAWVIPFNVAVLAVLALRGMPPGRVAIQIAAFVGSMVVFKFRIHRAIAGHQEAAPTALIAGSALYFLGLINTGGLASPLVATGIPMLMSASMQPIAPRARNAAYAFFIAGAVVVAAFAHSRFGLLPEPLAAVGGYSSTEYVVIAMGALIFTWARASPGSTSASPSSSPSAAKRSATRARTARARSRASPPASRTR
jgi:hypothetical protein